jgi:GTPase
MASMKDPVRKLIVPVLIVCAFFTVGGMTLLEEYFYRTRPRVPDATTQRVYAADVKSIRGVARVYLTRIEKTPFDVMRYWSPILVAATITTAWILVLRKRRRDGTPG